jgi:hypothetical protein
LPVIEKESRRPGPGGARFFADLGHLSISGKIPPRGCEARTWRRFADENHPDSELDFVDFKSRA